MSALNRVFVSVDIYISNILPYRNNVLLPGGLADSYEINNYTRKLFVKISVTYFNAYATRTEIHRCAVIAFRDMLSLCHTPANATSHNQLVSVAAIAHSFNTQLPRPTLNCDPSINLVDASA